MWFGEFVIVVLIYIIVFIDSYIGVWIVDGLVVVGCFVYMGFFEWKRCMFISIKDIINRVVILLCVIVISNGNLKIILLMFSKIWSNNNFRL